MPDVYMKENLFRLEGGQEIGDASVLNATTFAADQDNYNPTDGVKTFNVAGVIATFGLGLDSNGNHIITGLLAPTPAKRMMVYITNTGVTGGNIVLSANNGSSLAGNRFDFNSNVTLQSMEGIWMIYNTTTSRWNEIARAV